MLEISIACEFDLTAFDALVDSGLAVSFFGAPPHFKLDGGRIIRECKDGFGPVTSFLMRRSIPFYLCCNTVLEATELEIDGQTWRTIEQVYSPINGVIVSRHWLAERIRERYPRFQFIFSSIGAFTEAWDEDFMFSNYDVVVCPTERLNDFSYVSRATNWSKVEIFLNSACVPCGESCRDHYRHHSEVNNRMKPDTDYLCPREGRVTSSKLRIRPTLADVSRYLELGVRRFKCIERTRRGQDFRKYLDLVRLASIRDPALIMLQKRYVKTTDPLLRLRIVLRQAELGVTNISEQLKGELSKISGKLDDNHMQLTIGPALDMLRATDPLWVSEWVEERVVDGSLEEELGARLAQPPRSAGSIDAGGKVL
jgi:collagenase-like PrtC family protease